MSNIRSDYYEDVGILYRFNSSAGDGYCVKRWRQDFEVGVDTPSYDGIPSATFYYMDDNFAPHNEFFENKKRLKEECMMKHDYPRNMYVDLKMKKELVTESDILAKFALLENNLSHKTLAFIKLEQVKKKINEGCIDLEKTVEVLQSLL